MGAHDVDSEPRVLLHIGPHKTGTTAIQGILASARSELEAQGVVYPGGPEGTHHAAARAVLHQPSGWPGDKERLPGQHVWSNLAAAALAAPRRGVISSEFFALTTLEQRARVVEDLGRDRVELVVAARNPGSIALSTWQQVLRDGKTGALEDWLRKDFDRPEPTPVMSHQGFWSWADTANLVDKWAEVLDIDRIRVVVIDETDKLLLPQTFEQLLDLPAGLLSARTPPLGNRSLSTPEAELFLATLGRVRDELRWSEFSLFFRSGFARHLLRNRPVPPGEAAARLPAWAAAQAEHEADASIVRLRASGVRVIGDLENLRAVPQPGDNAAGGSVSTELAAEALAGVVLAANQRIRSLEEQLADVRERDLEALTAGQLAGVLRTRVGGGLRRRLTRR
jgi:hypothetical protein